MKKLTPEQIKRQSIAKWKADKAEAALTPEQRAERKRREAAYAKQPLVI